MKKEEIVVHKTMSLEGGIDMYNMSGKRYLSDEPPYGRKVKFRSENGSDYDLERANEYFTKGQILTVEEIEVSRFSSVVRFLEFSGEEFNAVMFTDVADTEN